MNSLIKRWYMSTYWMQEFDKLFSTKKRAPMLLMWTCMGSVTKILRKVRMLQIKRIPEITLDKVINSTSINDKLIMHCAWDLYAMSTLSKKIENPERLLQVSLSPAKSLSENLWFQIFLEFGVIWIINLFLLVFRMYLIILIMYK